MSTIAPPMPPGTTTRRRRRWGHWTAMTALTTVCLLGVAGVVWLSTRSGEAEGVALSLLFAVIPLPLVIGAYVWVDRYEPEPRRYMIAALAWGGVIAVALALPIQLLAVRNTGLSDSQIATFIAPVTEEPAKDLFLLLLLWRRRHTFDGIVDGLLYAGLVGIGFAFTENVGYYSTTYAGLPGVPMEGAQATTGLFIIRGLLSPFTHSLFVTAFGVGLGVAVATRRRWLRWVAPAAGFCVGAGLHGLWNGSISYGGGKGFLLVYLCGMVPVFVGFVGLAAWARRREGMLLIRGLEDAAVRGWLHRDEIPWLSRFPLRRAARRYAPTLAGPGADQHVREYQRLATKMAFLHQRVLTGRAGPDGPHRVYLLLEQMHAVRPYVRLPPPLRQTLAHWPGRGRLHLDGSRWPPG